MTKSVKLNTDILRLAILIFSFFMLCLGLKGGDIIIWKWGCTLSFPVPAGFYQGLGWLLLALTALLVLAAFSESVRGKLRLEDILRDDTETDNGTIAAARYGKWLIMFLVLFAGWLGFLSKSPPQSLAFNVLFWFGFILCCVVLAVPAMKARRISFTKKQQNAKRHISKWAVIKQTIERRIKWAKENRLSIRIEWQKNNTAAEKPSEKPVYSWTEEQIIEIRNQLNRLEQGSTNVYLESLAWMFLTIALTSVGIWITGKAGMSVSVFGWVALLMWPLAIGTFLGLLIRYARQRKQL